MVDVTQHFSSPLSGARGGKAIREAGVLCRNRLCSDDQTMACSNKLELRVELEALAVNCDLFNYQFLD